MDCSNANQVITSSQMVWCVLLYNQMKQDINQKKFNLNFIDISISQHTHHKVVVYTVFGSGKWRYQQIHYNAKIFKIKFEELIQRLFLLLADSNAINKFRHFAAHIYLIYFYFLKWCRNFFFCVLAHYIFI